jgi:acetyltransferase-like isoleucine patch superfamily enzyme
MIRFIYRSFRKIFYLAHYNFSRIITFLRLKGNGVQYGKNLKSYGSPVIDLWKGGKLTIGDNVVFNNGRLYNMIGRQQSCCFVVRTGAELIIGSNTGMSATAIVCTSKITIGNYVKIGGNTVIYDTDFHSLDALQRSVLSSDIANTRNAPVIIGDHVFIGAHSTILKGITIGENSIVGSCSVVTKNIPPNEIWAGNPAKFIKSLNKTALAQA